MLPVEPEQPIHTCQPPLYSWSYQTPLAIEPLPVGVWLDPRIIEINGMKFQARSDCDYGCDPYKIVAKIEALKTKSKAWKDKYPQYTPSNILGSALLDSLWFFVYFVIKNPLANHPFVVGACKEVQAEDGDSLELWARDHLKTTIITVAKTCQQVLENPEERILIFAATRPLAVKILNLIRALFESAILVDCFPNILYADPAKDADKWSEAPEGGLIVKRVGFYKEPTIAAAGLIEGMPTGDHYTRIKYDDIVTQDHQSPEIIEKVITNFDMTVNLGSSFGKVTRTVVGTPYRHDDPLNHIEELKDPVTEQPIFKVRRKPATHNGEFNGKSVFIPERMMSQRRATKNRYLFHCQQLVNATPRGQEKLKRAYLKRVTKLELPMGLRKFMIIDGAGDKGRRADHKSPDCWAMGVFGVEPIRHRDGSNRVFILDLLIEQMDLLQAQKAAVDMVCRNGRIEKLGIEKVGMSTTEIHICSALKAKDRHYSEENGRLRILQPEGRPKQFRIESALPWPLENGRIHYVDTVRAAAIERLGQEMDKFPAWHDDGLDILSYLYDILKDYRFETLSDPQKPESKYDAAFRKAREGSAKGWIAV